MHLDSLKIRQIDTLLASFADLRMRTPPSGGWIRTVRDALGMSLRQLGNRAQLSKNAVANAERNEAKGTIQLNTLKSIANAMDCELVYAIVPRQSLAATIDQQAARISTTLVGRVSESMELESQSVSASDKEHQLNELTASIIRDRGADFWDVG